MNNYGGAQIKHERLYFWLYYFHSIMVLHTKGMKKMQFFLAFHRVGVLISVYKLRSKTKKVMNIFQKNFSINSHLNYL